MTDKRNYWLDQEAARLFNKWKTNYLKYKRMDFEDAPAEMRVHFKKIVLIEEQKQKDMVALREKQAKMTQKDTAQAYKDIRVGLDKRRIR